MRDFLATFFFDNRIITKKISEAIKQGEGPSFLESIGLTENTDLPFFTENGRFYLDSHGSSVRSYVNGNIAEQHELANGDYITFKGENNENVYGVLFIETAKINVGYQKYQLDINKNIFIGRTPENDICFDLNNYLSREKHAVIRVDSSGDAFIEDLKRSTGVFLNGKRTNSAKISLHDEIYIMGLSMVYMGEYLAVRDLNLTCRLPEYQGIPLKEPVNTKAEKTKYFVRSARILKSVDTGVFEIDPPTASQRMKKLPLVLTMGPSLTMSIAMLTSVGYSVANLATGGSMQSVVTSGVMAVSMLLGALMWPSLMNRYQKKQEDADEKNRKEKYHQYISNIDHELAAIYQRNTRIWNDVLSPPPDALCEFLGSEEKQLRLWERSEIDDDFLCVRVGTGYNDFEVDIAIPKRGFTLDDDELYRLPQTIAEKYKVLRDVPVTLDLRALKTVGFIGRPDNIEIIAKQIIINIAALHAYDEVKMAFIGSESDLAEYEWVGELPHVWSTDREIRYIATNRNEVHEICSSIDETVKEREESGSPNIPYFVFFITDPSLIENESLVRYIENSKNQVGISSLFLYGDISKLPKDCGTILQSDNTRTGYYSKNKNNNRFIPFNIEPVNLAKVSEFAKRLSSLNVKIDVKNLSIPNTVSFLQLYKTGNIAGLAIEQHWNNNASNKTLAAPIGILAGGEVFSLDIHEAFHGCHGLVAGMTGSGKSEFLQAYILSMAVNYSPNEIAFVLVDFKGGDMARPFMAKARSGALPHLSATISNLSGNILYRALVSFEAEIKTRQRIFNESAAMLGVDKLDINSYHRYFKEGKLKTPLPHLIIIIDEFAQLKSQQPDFLAQLINVAQVGRSLGIHLILATQKPSGVVDPQIWSNSRFRVCLKVLDKQDSAEMIGRAEAAMIKQPGRCFVQVGYDEVFACVQSGYSGADYIPSSVYLPDEEITIHLADNTATPIRSAKYSIAGQKTDKTQLEEIVSEMVKVGEQKEFRAKPLWCELLKERILLEELGDIPDRAQEEPALRALIAMVDHVKTQQQLPLEIDLLKTGHIALYGAAGTGKTTYVQTLLYSLVNRYTPEELNIYTIDLGGRALGYLNVLPHSGGVVFSDNETGIADVIDTIQTIIDERKVLFEGKNCSSYTEYLRATGQKLPAVLMVIDNYAPFRDKFYHMEDSIVNLVSTGKTYGVLAVITGNSRNAIYYKVCEHISTYYTLRMNDNMNYRDILNTFIPIEPENVKGRGITVIDGNVVEFQVALSVDGENEAERVNTISRRFAKYAETWNGNKPAKLGGGASPTVRKDTQPEKPLSSKPLQKGRSNPPESIEDTPHTVVVGSSVSGALKYGIYLMSAKTLFIGARSKDENKRYMSYLLNKIGEYEKRQVILVDDETASMQSLLSAVPNGVYINSSNSFSGLVDELEKTIAARKEKYGELTSAGLADEVIYGNMVSFDKKFIVISDFKDFYQMITDDDADRFTRIIKESDNLGIYFITAAGFEGLEDYNLAEMYIYLIKSRDGVICGASIDLKEAGLLCSEMIDIAVSQKAQAIDNQCLFYSNAKSVTVTF